jgi:hypothetical protein
MQNLSPHPSLEPLSRLHVADGLLLNADRWQHAHNYHRRRQNLHYQSLHQPGIVWGLGVRVISAPIETAAPYRDGRWLEIQPGIAIDLSGNPIIVDQPISFRVASEAIDQPLIVYLVVRYVDPTTLQRTTYQDIVQETFRIDEKTSPPIGADVELCRICLKPGTVTLSNAPDVFAPAPNQIDLCHRSTAQTRTQGTIRMAQFNSQAVPLEARLSRLLRSLPTLYPKLQGLEPIVTVDVELEDTTINQDYDIIYLSYTLLG